MRFRRYILGICIVILGVILKSEMVSAATVYRDAWVNSSIETRRGDPVSAETYIEGWHYEDDGGYWKFNWQNTGGGLNIKRVDDSDIPTYFSGYSKEFDNIVYDISVPAYITDILNTEGPSYVGIKFNLGQYGNIKNDTIDYSFVNNNRTLRIGFKPILRYDTYDMWGSNSDIWSHMKKTVYTPQVSDGYGCNYLSIYDGTRALTLYPYLIQYAYWSGDGNVMFHCSGTGTDSAGNTFPWPSVYSAGSTFDGGGNNGVSFRYDGTVEFFANSPRPVQDWTKVQYYNYKNGNDYWYKSGESIVLRNQYRISADFLLGANIKLSKSGSTDSSDHSFFRYTNGTDASGNPVADVQAGNAPGVDKSSYSASNPSGGADKKWNEYEYRFRINGDYDYYVRSYAISSANIPSTDDDSEMPIGYGDIRIRTDGTPPEGKFDPGPKTDEIYQTQVKFTPSDDRSGVKSWEYKIGKVDADNSVTWGSTIQASSINAQEITLNSIGKWKIQCTVYDNVGNSAVFTSGTYNIIDPKPINGKLEVRNYGFQEYNDLNDNGIKDSNESLKPIYWVKQNIHYDDPQFGIYTDGYFPSSYGVYPTRTYVLYAKDGVYNINSAARQYAYKDGSDIYGSEYNNYFRFTDAGGAEFPPTINGKNYIMHTHMAEGLNHGDKFKLYFTNSYIEDGTEYYNGYVDSGDWLKVDGKAPTGNGLIDLDDKTLDMTITASDVTDSDSGVGADSVWAMIYPLEDDKNVTSDINDFKGNTEYKTSDKMKKKLIRQSDGLYKLTLNAYDDAYKSDKVKVVIGAIDNVGNIGTLKEETLDLFTLKARIVPLNNMDYNSNTPPTLKRGQAGVLIMEVTGGAESLDIEYQELDALDDSLDKTITINPVVKYKIQNDNFIVPLYCDEKNYKVKVVAHKGNSTREAYPEMIVSDSVLNGIRTRVR